MCCISIVQVTIGHLHYCMLSGNISLVLLYHDLSGFLGLRIFVLVG